MKDVARRSLLLDFYGALLTDKQREIYDWYYQQDFSLGEIGELAQVSRNAVYDLVSRTDEKLERYEKLLDLIGAYEREKKAKEDLALAFEAWLAGIREGDLAARQGTALAEVLADGDILAFQGLVARLRM